MDRLLIAIIAIGTILVLTTGSATAANNSTIDYYNNSSSPNQGTWMAGAEDPTIGNITGYIGRIQGLLIGSGYSAVGGGSLAAMLSGGLVIFMVIGTAVGTGLGLPAGSVVGIATAAALADLGLLPSWLYAVLLFLLGIVLTTVYIRTQ